MPATEENLFAGIDKTAFFVTEKTCFSPIDIELGGKEPYR